MPLVTTVRNLLCNCNFLPSVLPTFSSLSHSRSPAPSISPSASPSASEAMLHSKGRTHRMQNKSDNGHDASLTMTKPGMHNAA